MPGAEPATALSALLEEERNALLAGDLGALSRVLTCRPGAEAALLDRPPDAAALQALREQAAHNARLLAAAAAGVRQVSETLRSARAGGPTLATYDAAGRATRHGGGTPRVSLRA